MKEKISITIDVSKIDKNKIVSRTWTDKEGVSKTVKELKLDIVPLKDTKVLKDTPEYTLYKTHFVAEQQTKEERALNIKSKIIGEGTMFKNKPKVEEEDEVPPMDEEDTSEIPF